MLPRADGSGRMSDLEETLALLRESADGFLKAEHSFKRLRSLVGLPSGLDRPVFAKMAELGWTGLRMSEALGGAGLPLEAAAVLAEAFGGALLPEPFVVAGIVPSAIASAMPAGSARDALVARLLRGDVVAPAFGETVNEAVLADPAAQVTLRGNRLLLNGCKLFVLGGADRYLVSARQDGQWVLIDLDPAAVGVTFETRRMADGTVTATLNAASVPLDEASILLRGTAAERTVQRATAEATAATAAQLTGLSGAVFATTVEYMGQRRQFGQSIMQFQALQHRLVDLRLQIELAGAGWRNAVRRYDAEPDAPATAQAISAAKARCSDAALLVCRSSIQLHGAIGYTDDADIGLFMKTAMRLASTFGNGTAHRSRFLTLHRRLAA